MPLFQRKEDIYRLMDKFEKSSISELELELDDNVKIRLKKQVVYTAPAHTAETAHGTRQSAFAPAIAAPGQLPFIAEGVTPEVIGEAHRQPALVNPKEGQKSIEPPKTEGKPVKAPLIGTFFAASSPEAAPFVSVGSKIKKGDTLCIIEAMKVMNEIESEIDGTITEVLVKNGEAVEFGQILFRVKE